MVSSFDWRIISYEAAAKAVSPPGSWPSPWRNLILPRVLKPGQILVPSTVRLQRLHVVFRAMAAIAILTSHCDNPVFANSREMRVCASNATSAS